MVYDPNKWNKEHPEYSKEKWAELRYEVLMHYTSVAMFEDRVNGYPAIPKCVDPYHKHLPNDPFQFDIRALTIDHINGKGASERKTLGSQARGNGFYYWLKNHGYPEGYQVLCFNCNWIKRLKNREGYRKGVKGYGI
jgi:hypothetical protein